MCDLPNYTFIKKRILIHFIILQYKPETYLITEMFILYSKLYDNCIDIWSTSVCSVSYCIQEGIDGLQDFLECFNTRLRRGYLSKL